MLQFLQALKIRPALLVRKAYVLEILKRARGPCDGDITSFNEPVPQDEINSRTYKAGYTDRDGQPRTSRMTSYSKGDGRRPVDPVKYDKNAKRLFGETKLNIWPRDKHGNLIE